jgi:hypothetical protein
MRVERVRVECVGGPRDGLIMDVPTPAPLYIDFPVPVDSDLVMLGTDPPTVQDYELRVYRYHIDKMGDGRVVYRPD